ncbi:hypothetical protein ACFY40_20710 [Streptomyces sp. NPDC012950]|uniref:hypothetical protein n=1 Tax=Streptomyces sp. NPDC012950 TaxID=3364858 RepID=UPI003695337F
MKLVVRVKLLPTPEQAAALDVTLRTCNEEANRLSVRAFECGRTSRAALQALAYAELKARGFPRSPRCTCCGRLPMPTPHCGRT